MAFAPDRPPRPIVVLCLVLSSSALVYFGTGLHPQWALPWIAALPLLWTAPRLSGGAAFGAALVAWFAGSLNMLRYLLQLLAPPDAPGGGTSALLPLAVALGLLLVPSVVFALAVSLWRTLVRRNAPGRAALALPAVWVAHEYLTAVASPHGTAGNLAYTQMDCLPVLQLASVLGVWGISFCPLFFAASIATLLRGTGTPGQRRRLAAGAGAFVTAVLAFGAWRLAVEPAADPVLVGLVASDLPGNVQQVKPDDMVRLLRDYADHVQALAMQGAQVVVLPEKLGVMADNAREADAVLEAAAARGKTLIVAGVIRRTSTAPLNEARAFSPAGAVVGVYDKHHLLPGFESWLRPGTERTLLTSSSGRWGIAICKDMDFPRLGREYAADGVGLLLVPAWDFGDDGWLHGRMAVMRGVESGFSIARAAKEGLLTVSDDRGRILAQASSSASAFASLVATAPVRHRATLYARLGDWFAWLDLLLLVAVVGSLRPWRRR